jgi:hypothetical protein
MSQQLNIDNLTVDSDITVDEAWDLLFGKDTSDEDVRIEEEANCTIGAGLDWGSAEGKLLLNLPLLGRLTTLRVSLNREIRLIIETWDLGVGATTALIAARDRIKEKLISPPDVVIPHLQAALQQDDLYGEEFISNREVLQSLLKTLLTESDWEAMREAATS